ncbi:unnamed protein product, partial [Symbiodinium sp. KB8]
KVYSFDRLRTALRAVILEDREPLLDILQSAARSSDEYIEIAPLVATLDALGVQVRDDDILMLLQRFKHPVLETAVNFRKLHAALGTLPPPSHMDPEEVRDSLPHPFDFIQEVLDGLLTRVWRKVQAGSSNPSLAAHRSSKHFTPLLAPADSAVAEEGGGVECVSSAGAGSVLLRCHADGRVTASDGSAALPNATPCSFPAFVPGAPVPKRSPAPPAWRPAGPDMPPGLAAALQAVLTWWGDGPGGALHDTPLQYSARGVTAAPTAPAPPPDHHRPRNAAELYNALAERVTGGTSGAGQATPRIAPGDIPAAIAA